MTINMNRDGGKLYVSLEGRLDINSSPQLENEVKSNIADVEELEFDFSNFAYISSAGLRVLLSAQKIMNRQGSAVWRCSGL